MKKNLKNQKKNNKSKFIKDPKDHIFKKKKFFFNKSLIYKRIKENYFFIKKKIF
jgi:hypothetical protein